jgi:PQQ-dependent catabolism-associated CXXCW motif protein
MACRCSMNTTSRSWSSGILCASAFVAAWTIPASAGDIAEPPGYRMDRYNAPVPETLEGAAVVTTEEAETLWRSGSAVFIDVMPHAPKPAGLPEGTIWREAVRRDIPGSVWLPNVGYGAISKETADYFREGLTAHVDHMSSKVLFYCMMDCWMSWNAAKRAIEWGYSSVLWYPLGADGWEFEGLPLAENRPSGNMR